MNSNKNLNLGNIIKNYASNAFKVIKRPAIILGTLGVIAYSLSGCDDNKTIIDNSIHSSNSSYIVGAASDSTAAVSIKNSNTGIIIQDNAPLPVYQQGDSVNNSIISNDSNLIGGNGVDISGSNTGIKVIRYSTNK